MRRKKIPKLEKPWGLYLEKILQDNCLYKSWGHCRVVWLLWWTPADSAEKIGISDSTKATEGARDHRLRRSLPSALGDTALYHSDLSWDFPKVKGPGLWVAWKNWQDSGSFQGQPPMMGDCLQQLHFSGLSQRNNVSFKKKLKKIQVTPFSFLEGGWHVHRHCSITEVSPMLYL